MAAEIDQLLARIERLEAELRELRATTQRVTATGMDDACAASDATPATTTRRRAVGVLAAGAVGAVAGAVGSQPAAAATGDAVLAGFVNTFNSGTQTTVLARGTASGAYVNAGINLEDNNGFGASLWGNWGNAYLWDISRDPVAADARYPGILWHRNGNVWVSVAVGQWRQIAGPNFSTVGPQGPAGPAGPPGPAGSASGGFTPLPVPTRVYDSRPERPEPGWKVEFGPNETREIDLTANGSGVPTTATAVQISYVIIAPPAAGYAVAWPTGPKPNTSQVNYPRGDVRGACVVIGAVNGRIFINSLGGGHVAIDVYGYFT